ncbi:MAG: hypothetical protein MOIL_00755 [Candidatus Methanolliviera sp. GoM_oil]|nr:MAG: hypothetical protein MOIL_00755 [Candidatus Methanolliviera sp. GoM_oil]
MHKNRRFLAYGNQRFPTIKIFTLPVCPKCHLLMDKMEELGIKFEELTMTDPEPQTELLMNDIYTNVTPVLFLNGRYYTHRDLFDGEYVRENIIKLLEGREVK